MLVGAVQNIIHFLAERDLAWKVARRSYDENDDSPSEVSIFIDSDEEALFFAELLNRLEVHQGGRWEKSAVWRKCFKLGTQKKKLHKVFYLYDDWDLGRIFTNQNFDHFTLNNHVAMRESQTVVPPIEAL